MGYKSKHRRDPLYYFVNKTTNLVVGLWYNLCQWGVPFRKQDGPWEMFYAVNEP